MIGLRSPALVALLLSLLVAPSVGAAEPQGFALHAGLGFRPSWTQEVSGLELSLGVDLLIGPLQIGLQMQGTNDHTLKAKENGVHARTLAWLSLAGQIYGDLPLVLAIGGGPGVGTIRSPAGTDRSASHGLHEFVQVSVLPGGRRSGLSLGFRVEQQQLWQPDRFAGIDHATSFRLVFGVRMFEDP